MSRFRMALILFIAAATTGSTTLVRAQAGKPTKAAPPAAKHVVMTADDLKWGPAPPSLPPGSQMAVIDGDPGKAGTPFVIRAKLPDGYRVPPHFHPTEENVTVLSGQFMAGMGDKMDEASMKPLGPGGFAKVPRQMHHYAMAKGETIIQVHGMGPFTVIYVNPNDDPRKKTATATR